MGRNGGPYGAAIQNDIQTGQWRGQMYEVRYQNATPNRNWFLIAEFVEMIEEIDL